MDFSLAHTLAADMIQRLVHNDNFFETLKEFDTQKQFKEEYAFAIKSAIAQRIPFENDDWRVNAHKFLVKQGVM